MKDGYYFLTPNKIMGGKQLKSIDIDFEDGDYLSFNAEDIIMLDFNINSDISDSFELKVDPNGDTVYSSPVTEFDGATISKFERVVKYKDITDITLYYDDGTVDKFVLLYNMANDNAMRSSNTFQTSEYLESLSGRQVNLHVLVNARGDE